MKKGILLGVLLILLLTGCGKESGGNKNYEIGETATLGNYKIQLVDTEIMPDAKGANAMKLNFKWTNGGEEEESLSDLFRISAHQGERKLDSVTFGVEVNNYNKKVKPGEESSDNYRWFYIKIRDTIEVDIHELNEENEPVGEPITFDVPVIVE